MFISALSFLKISGGHGEPAMIPKNSSALMRRLHILAKHVTKFMSYYYSKVLPVSTEDKSYLFTYCWLSMSVNMVGVP